MKRKNNAKNISKKIIKQEKRSNINIISNNNNNITNTSRSNIKSNIRR